MYSGTENSLILFSLIAFFHVQHIINQGKQAETMTSTPLTPLTRRKIGVSMVSLWTCMRTKSSKEASVTFNQLQPFDELKPWTP